MWANKLILGTVQLGLDYGINNSCGKPDKQQALNILSAAANAGINTLDTASAYGNAEQLIGEYHSTHSHFQVNTKIHLDSGMPVKSLVEERIEILGLESLNVLFMHRFSEFARLNPAQSDEILQCKQDGKFKKLGVSVYTNDEFILAAEDGRADVIQIPYNLLDCNSEKSQIISYAKSRGREIHARSVFLQGLFFKEPASVPERLKPLSGDLARIKQIASERGITMEQLALSFVLQQQEIDYVLIGVETEAQLQSNLGVLNEILPDDLKEELAAAAPSDTFLLNPVNWTLQ